MTKKDDEMKGIDSNIDLDFGNLDDDIFGDISSSPSNSSKSRSPISNVKAGALQGLKLRSKDVSDIGKSISDNFTHAGSAMDSTLSTAGELTDNIRNLKESVAPNLRRLKAASRKALPHAKKFVPSKIYDKLKKKLESDDDGYRSKSLEENRTDFIKNQLSDIFKVQVDLQEQKDLSDTRNKIIDQHVDDKKFVTSITVLSKIKNLIKSQQAFLQTGVKTFIIKSLELKYKHLFVSQDMLLIQQKMLDITDNKLNDIIINTALPDIQKQTQSESFKEAMRAKTFGSAAETVGDYTATFFSKISENVKKNIFNKLKDSIEEYSDMGTDLIEGWTELEEMKKDEGEEEEESSFLSKTSSGVSFLKALGIKHAGKLVKKLGGQRAKDFDDMFLSLKENAPFLINTKIQELTEKEGVVGKIAEFLDNEIIPSLREERGEITNIAYNNPTDPIPWDVVSRKTLVEIIPGYLAQITKHSETVATGKIADELAYDFGSETFIPVKELKEKTYKKYFGTQKSRTQEIEKMIGTIRGGFTNNGGDPGDFNEQMPNIVKFVNNLVKHNQSLLPKEIRKFRNGESYNHNYISWAFKDISDPLSLAEILVTALFKEDKIATDVVKEFSTERLSLAKSRDNYLKELGKLNVFGQKRFFSDLIGNEKTLSDVKTFKDDLVAKYKKKSKKNILDEKALKEIESKVLAFSNSKGLNHTLIRNILEDVDYDALYESSEKRGDEFSSKIDELNEQREEVDERIQSTLRATTNKEERDKVILKIQKAYEEKSGKSFEESDNFLGKLKTVFSKEQRQDAYKQVEKAYQEESNKSTSESSTPNTDALADQARDQVEKAYQEISLGTKSKLDTIKSSTLADQARDQVEKAYQEISLGTKSKLDTIKSSTLADQVRDQVEKAYQEESHKGKDIPIKDDPHISGPGMYVQGSEYEAHIPLDSPESFFKEFDNILREIDYSTTLVEIRDILKESGTISLASLMGGVSENKPGIIGKALGLGKSSISNVMKLYGKGLGSGISAFKKIVKFPFKEKKDKITDGYRFDRLIPGFPLFTRKQILNGELIRSDGKIIKSIKDITMPVIDKLTGKVIISQEDIDAGLVNIKGNPLIKKLSSGALSAGSKFLKGALSVTGIYGQVLSLVGSTMKKGITKLFSKSMDVYRKDKIVPGFPLVTKSQIDNGDLVRSDGVVIKNIKDMTLPVLSTITGETLITQEDIDAGLVNIKGKSIAQKLGSRVLSAGKGILNAGVSFGKGVVGAGVGALSLGISAISGLTKKIFGSSKGKESKKGIFERIGDTVTLPLESKSDKIIERLDTIITRLPEPKKTREGSYEDSIADELSDDGIGTTGSTKSAKTKRKTTLANRMKALKDKYKKKGSSTKKSGLIGGIAKKYGGAALASLGGALVGSGGIGAATAATGAALGTGAAAAGSAAIATGVFLVSNPIGWAILGTLAVGAIGYGAYKLFSDSKQEKISLKVRMSIYSASEKQDGEIKDLEEETLENIEDGDKFDDDDIRDWAEEFGFDPKDKQQVNFWYTWYVKKFVPSLMLYKSLVKQHAEKEFNEIDEIDMSVLETINKTFIKLANQKLSAYTKFAPNKEAFNMVNKPKEVKEKTKASNKGKAATALIAEVKSTEKGIKDKVKDRFKSLKSFGGNLLKYSPAGLMIKAGKAIYNSVKTEDISPTPNVVAVSKMLPNASDLGSLSARYESGNKGPSSIGFDQVGGTSYGSYQIATRVGAFNKFLAYAASNGANDVVKRLVNAGDPDGGVNGPVANEWRKLAKEGKISAIEKAFIKNTYYIPALNGLDPEIMNLVNSSPALQQVLWSTSVQHGAYRASEIFNSLYTSGISKKEFIEKIYNDRGRRFVSSSPQIQASVKRRFVNEKQLAINMIKNSEDISVESPENSSAMSSASLTPSISTTNTNSFIKPVSMTSSSIETADQLANNSVPEFMSKSVVSKSTNPKIQISDLIKINRRQLETLEEIRNGISVLGKIAAKSTNVSPDDINNMTSNMMRKIEDLSSNTTAQPVSSDREYDINMNNLIDISKKETIAI